MKRLQPATVVYVFRAKAPQCHINRPLITADKLRSGALDLAWPWSGEAAEKEASEEYLSVESIQNLETRRGSLGDGEKAAPST